MDLVAFQITPKTILRGEALKNGKHQHTYKFYNNGGGKFGKGILNNEKIFETNVFEKKCNVRSQLIYLAVTAHKN